MIRTNPHEICAIKGDSVTTPDVLGIEVSDGNVLNDDVLCSICDAETLPTNNALVANTDDGLVGPQVDRGSSSIVVFDLNACSSSPSIAVGAPVSTVDGVLASIAIARAGGTVTVLEAAHQLGEIGAGIQMVALALLAPRCADPSTRPQTFRAC